MSQAIVQCNAVQCKYMIGFFLKRFPRQVCGFKEYQKKILGTFDTSFHYTYWMQGVQKSFKGFLSYYHQNRAANLAYAAGIFAISVLKMPSWDLNLSHIYILNFYPLAPQEVDIRTTVEFPSECFWYYCIPYIDVVCLVYL